MKFKKIELNENLYFFKSPDLNCYLDDKKVNMGLIVEILDTREFDDMADENFPFIVSMGLMTSRPHKSFDAWDGENPTSIESLIYDCNSYMSSIPVDHFLQDAINGGLDEILPLFNVGEAKKVTIRPKFGTIAAQKGPGSEYSYLQFSDLDQAEKFIDFIIENRVHSLTMTIGFILDRPINIMGENGWGQVETMVNGSKYNLKREV